MIARKRFLESLGSFPGRFGFRGTNTKSKAQKLTLEVNTRREHQKGTPEVVQEVNVR